MTGRMIVAGVVLVFPTLGSASDFSFQWSAAPGDPAPQVSVCPFMYGKTWAYTTEIDDGPSSVLSVAQPLFAQYDFTNAPPGVAGGKLMPFVGGVSVITMKTGTSNNTYLGWNDLRTLQADGWGVLNHSYSHLVPPTGGLTTAQINRELFWSQQVLADQLGGTAPTHFVYPNGDTEYAPYLAQYGLQTGSRYGASDAGFPYAANSNWHDLNRSLLDGTWSNGPLTSFPANPAAGQVVIDFTHYVDASSQAQWNSRLQAISAKYGAAGLDNVWVAPTGAIYQYATAAKDATVQATSGKVTLSLPDTIPNSALTLKITGISPTTVLTAPAGGTIYRDANNNVYLTTPTIAPAKSLLPQPQVQLVYSGPLKNLTFSQPISLAAVRIMQAAPVAANFTLQINAQKTDGGVQNIVPAGQENPNGGWGAWMPYYVVPNQAAIPINGLTVTTDPNLQQMEVWAVVPEPTGLAALGAGGLLLMRRRRQ